jgi:long-chain acyl-CoA synthetase
MADDTLAQREAVEIDAAIADRTIVDIFSNNASRYGDRPAVHYREGSEWKTVTWSEYRQQVLELAAGLASLGLEKDGFAAIQAANRPEHMMADLAAIHLGATGVTLYSTLSPPQVAYIANDCSASVAILENRDFFKTWEQIKPQLPNLKYVVLMEDADEFSGIDWVLSLDEVMQRGRSRLAENPELIDTRDIQPEGLATLIYTSGTTGNPKGVMITHRNVVWTSESVRRTFDLPEHPRLVSYLPLAHIAERLAGHYYAIYSAAEVWTCPDITQVLDYIQNARPTLFVGVPRVWEKFYTRLRSRFEETGGVKGKLLDKAIDLGLKKFDAEQAGRSLGGLDAFLHGLLDKVVLAKVREQLGMDAVTDSISTAAPITPDLLRFFQALGIPVYELYGMSENTGPAITNRREANRVGSVGIPLAGVEVRLADDGEVLMRGGIVAPGYYNLPEETAATFTPDGWLHSGDLGRIDEDGFAYIVGRKKEILITAAGKNVAPAKLETIMGNHALISKACMVGDGRHYLTMIIALDAEEAPLWAERRGVPFESLAAFSRQPEVLAEIDRAMKEANDQVSRAEQVKKYVIVPDEWTPESGEVTPSLKLKRRVVLERYADEIDQMYVG